MTIGAAIAQLLLHLIAYQDQIYMVEMLVTMLIVFTTVTAYFMSKSKEVKLRKTLDNLAKERDHLLKFLPKECAQVLILDKKKYTKLRFSTKGLRK